MLPRRRGGRPGPDFRETGRKPTPLTGLPTSPVNPDEYVMPKGAARDAYHRSDLDGQRQRELLGQLVQLVNTPAPLGGTTMTGAPAQQTGQQAQQSPRPQPQAQQPQAPQPQAVQQQPQQPTDPLTRMREQLKAQGITLGGNPERQRYLQDVQRQMEGLNRTEQGYRQAMSRESNPLRVRELGKALRQVQARRAAFDQLYWKGRWEMGAQGPGQKAAIDLAANIARMEKERGYRLADQAHEEGVRRVEVAATEKRWQEDFTQRSEALQLRRQELARLQEETILSRDKFQRLEGKDAAEAARQPEKERISQLDFKIDRADKALTRLDSGLGKLMKLLEDEKIDQQRREKLQGQIDDVLARQKSVMNDMERYQGQRAGEATGAPKKLAPTSISPSTRTRKKLDDATMDAILNEVGDDPDKAAKLAKQRGYTW